MMNWIVGVDFDNTIVNYDFLIHDEALRRGLIDRDVVGSKKEIRDRIRKLPEGEIEWQRVQACVYGPRMREAELIPGVQDFFQRCRNEGIQTYIVSHKTEFANFDEARVNLRDAALAWMKSQKFFELNGFGLVQTDVFFGATRLEKIDYIRQLRCTHFIDDLEELFREAAFPECIKKILYAPYRQEQKLTGIKIAFSWQEIYGYFFEVAK